MDTYNLYIGANNETGEVETEKLRTILDKYYKGYTIVNSVGAWEGQREPSVIVTVVSEEIELYRFIGEVKVALKQDAVGIQEVSQVEFV